MIGKEIVESLDKKTEERMEEEQKKRRTGEILNHASEAGWVDDCLRFLVAKRLYPDREELPALEMQRRYEEGKAQEVVMRHELLAAGHKVAEARPMIWPDYELTGEVDDLLVRDTDLFPLDYKSASTHMFYRIAKCSQPSELLNSKHYWVRHYVAQLNLYDKLYEYPCGLLLFKDKDRNVKHGIDVPMDSQYTNHILKGLEEVNNHVAKKTLPPAEHKDICAHCGFCWTLCFDESKIHRPEVKVVEDPEWELKLNRMSEVEKVGKEYNKLLKEAKDTWRGENVIIGDHRIYSTPYEVDGHDLPPEVQAEIEKLKEKHKVKQERIRMAFKNLARSL